MLKIQYILPSPLAEAAQSQLRENDAEQPQRRRLRLYLVGSQDDAQYTIDHLHLRGCIEHLEWSREIGIPEGGLLIRPDEGDVLRYLQRYRRFS